MKKFKVNGIKKFKVTVRETSITSYFVSSRDVQDAEDAKAEIEGMTDRERDLLQSQVESSEWFVDTIEEVDD
jgi:hypothetical protein